jgi:hypothetical protein
MNRLLVHSVLLALAIILALSGSSVVLAQQNPPSPSEEPMTSEEFTNYLKTIWSFLKAETETYQSAVGTKTEFETTKEFEERSVNRRQQYLANIVKYSKDQKLKQRNIALSFKAVLVRYDADKKIYALQSATVIDAPYNIPTVRCVVPKNPYLALADSIRAGYRTSVLYLNIAPEYRWQVSRDVAQAAKQTEADVFFKATVTVDIESNDGKSEAKLYIVPKEFSLINKGTNQVYLSRKLQ